MGAFYLKESGKFHFHNDLPKLNTDPKSENNDKPPLDESGNHVLESKLVHSSPEIGIAYCQLEDRIHIFTHGTADGMKAWVEAHNSHSPHKAILKIFDQSTPVEVINKAIIDHSFFASLL